MTEQVKPQTGYAELNGAKFYYEMAGAGEPLVLIHAGIADRRMWDEQFYTFAEHHRVVRYDLRGYGNTAVSAGSDSPVQDLYKLLLGLGIERASLLGCSQGGATALDFALEYPHTVDRVILVSTVPSGYQFEGGPPPKLLEFISAYRQQDLARASELAAQIWFDGPERKASQVDATARLVVLNLIKDVLARRALDLTGGQLTARTAADRLADVQTPALIVVGEHDDASILTAGETLAASIPGAKKIVIRGAAHLPNLERPQEFNRVVLDFLKKE